MGCSPSNQIATNLRMGTPKVRYEEIQYDRLMLLFAEHGVVEVELSRDQGWLIVALAKQHAFLDDSARSRPGWLADQLRLLYALALVFLIETRPRLSELRHFWVLSRATIGCDITPTRRYLIGFLGGRP